MSPTKPPHFWASLENECILHQKKNKIKGTSGVEIKRKRNQESKGKIHHKIIVPFYGFFLL